MNEYRCTRNFVGGYPYSPNSLAAKDKSTRQGHYVHARSEVEAFTKMSEDFPQDVKGRDLAAVFTVDYHKDVSDWYKESS